MKTFLKIVLGALGVVVFAVVVLLVGARFADGPVAIVAGGPFTSGDAYSGPEPGLVVRARRWRGGSSSSSIRIARGPRGS